MFSKTPIPTKLVIALLAVGLLASVFGAWREQYLKGKPGLQGEILSLVWSELAAEKTLLLLQLQIVNTGPPTIARGYEAKIHLPDGTQLGATPSHVRIGLELRSPTETMIVDRLIYEETISPIPSGGQAGGWIAFELSAHRERLRNPDTIIVLRFRDARDIQYAVTAPATGTGMGLKYYPGAGAAPAMNESSSSPEGQSSPPQ